MFTVIGALSNRILRGSGKVRFGKVLNAILFGICAAIASKFDILFGGLMAVEMFLGQSFAIPHNQTIRGNEWPMFFRGLAWVSLLSAAMLVTHHNPVFYLPAALSMYLVYHGADRYFVHHKATKLFDQVVVAELIYGALLWFPLDMLFLHVHGVL